MVKPATTLKLKEQRLRQIKNHKMPTPYKIYAQIETNTKQ